VDPQHIEGYFDGEWKKRKAPILFDWGFIYYNPKILETTAGSFLGV
jgi:hypothetical protein